MSINDIHWEDIAAKLPVERSDDAVAQLKDPSLDGPDPSLESQDTSLDSQDCDEVNVSVFDESVAEELFESFDVNKNGYLSLAEVDKGLRDVLQIETFDAKPAIARAFHEAIKHARAEGEGPDFIKREEFGVLLGFLNNYFELWVMFGSIDSDIDRVIEFDEFATALPRLDDWGVSISEKEAAAVFASIDSHNGGHVDFVEFCAWAISQRLKRGDETQAAVANKETITADFEEFDFSGEGTITKDDLATVFRQLNSTIGEYELDQMLGLAQLGSDGIVKYKEFITWLFEHGA